MTVTKEMVVLTKENMNEVMERINDFCKEGFHKTHDWLKFVDKADKTLEECTFEKEYPFYQYHKGAKWIESENYNKQPIIYLFTQQHGNNVVCIQLGAKILFEENSILYILELNDWKQYVGKIYKQ